jgi:hypothetical protein
MVLAVLAGFVLFCSNPVYGQTVPDGNLAEALAGVFCIINRAESWNGRDGGQDLDRSLTWEYVRTGERDVLRMAFNNFRYYAAKGDPSGNRVAALSGDLELGMEDELITGAVTVKGIPQVSSLTFDKFHTYESGSLEVNGRRYDNDSVEDILDEAVYLIEDNEIVTPEIEAGLLFYIMLSAIEEAGLAEVMPDDIDGDTNIPPGITGSNPQGTVKFVTRKNTFDMSFNAYEFEEDFFEGVYPLLDGNFVIEYNFKPDNMISFVWNSLFRVKNISFVSSMGFDSCTFGESTSGEDISGSIIINGVSHDFQDFLQVLGVLDVF